MMTYSKSFGLMYVSIIFTHDIILFSDQCTTKVPNTYIDLSKMLGILTRPLLVFPKVFYIFLSKTHQSPSWCCDSIHHPGKVNYM